MTPVGRTVLDNAAVSTHSNRSTCFSLAISYSDALMIIPMPGALSGAQLRIFDSLKFPQPTAHDNPFQEHTLPAYRPTFGRSGCPVTHLYNTSEDRESFFRYSAEWCRGLGPDTRLG